MHFLLLILVLLAVALFFTVKLKAKTGKSVFFYSLVIVDLYISGVLIYFLSSAILA